MCHEHGAGDGEWRYSIHVLDEEISCSVMTDDLMPPGAFITREDFYGVSSVTVIVDPETGEGRLRNDRHGLSTPYP